ncbi:MAG TPA: O-antigen ligase family protein [Terriglobales bacterium]|nr:O-antigen ligase family protein [Terriglobales bacterium]
MFDRIPKPVLIASLLLVPIALTYLAYTTPAYFTSQTYLGGLLFLELLIAAIWMYRQVFFPLVMVTFLLAGVDLPVGSGWTAARWVTLGVGALVGLLIVLKQRRYSLRLFHLLALFAVLSAVVSAAVSRYESTSLFKVLSLFALFVYAGTGARLAVLGRENRFFSELLVGCEVFVGIIAAAYLVGIEVMGNPNSLGAVMGVIAAPILLWGTLVSENQFERRRRAVMFTVCASLLFVSHARAGMVAAFVSCALLCSVLRRYRLLVQGLVVIVIVAAASAILRPEAYSNTISSFTNRVVFKAKDASGSLFESRQTPWQQAIDSIQNHLWFGTGFGTSDNGQEPTDHVGKFSTVASISTEFGSSYLAITTWVGLLGVLPFLMLVLVLLNKIVQTVRWMIRTGNPAHPAIPLAMVMLAGMIHAGFEDWLFAPGYYVTVFFWSMAFVFVDEAPSPAIAASRRTFLSPAVMRPSLSVK